MHNIRALLRFIQFCIFLIIGLIFTAQLPLAFSKVTGEYLRGLTVPLISPRFVFVLGNAIVIILFLKSRHSLAKDVSVSTENFDFSDERLKEYVKNQNVYNEQSKKEKKQNVSVSGTNNKIRRSQSENLARVHHLREPGKELTRPATFSCRKRVMAATNEMSNEDFLRTVEAFIARRQRSLREEEFSAIRLSCES